MKHQKRTFILPEQMKTALLAMIILGLLSAPLAAVEPIRDNMDGTITDKTTGLIWTKCLRGENYSGGACVWDGVTNTSIPWYNAWLYCSTLNYNSRSWRLPNIQELTSLYISNRESANPATMGGWTSTTYVFKNNIFSDRAYVYDPAGFNMFTNMFKTASNTVICVSDGPY